LQATGLIEHNEENVSVGSGLAYRNVFFNIDQPVVNLDFRVHIN